MQTLAVGVGDLKRVLSNVKTRGILGEIQLGAILEEILAPEQFDREVAIKRNTKVEFAIKLPGDNGDTVYLPVDSKFPVEAYQKLMDAYESADPALVKTSGAALCQALKVSAKNISTPLRPPVSPLCSCQPKDCTPNPQSLALLRRSGVSSTYA